jgi:hypothetical protein
MYRLLLIFAITAVCYAETISNGPFAGFDLSKVSVEDARAIREANEDFSRAVAGLSPKFASLVSEELHKKGDIRREHLLTFKGYRYHLSVAKLPIRVGEQEGVLFGPAINFDAGFTAGYLPTVAEQRFYTRAALSQLLKGEGRWIILPTQGEEVNILRREPR